MPGSLRIARLFGITIFIHASWVLVAILVLFNFLAFFSEGGAWQFGDFVLTVQSPLPRDELRWLAAGATTVLFFGSVLVHELSHSLVAQRLGLPVHSITLFIFGGVSNLRREPESAKSEFLMAAVGPATSLVLGALFWLLLKLAGDTVLGDPPQQAAASVFRQIAVINVILAIFNLLPGFPLDGGRVLRSAVWAMRRDRRTATRIATRGGQLLAGLLVLWGFYHLTRQDLISGMWSMLIAFFLYNAASASYQQESFDASLRRLNVASLMTREPTGVPVDLPLAALVSTYILPLRGRAFPVELAGELLGIVSVEHVRRVPQDEWPRRRVGEVMTPVARLEPLKPEDDARRAFERLMRGEAAQLPVFEDGRLVGLFERDVIFGYLRMREELGLDRRR